MLARQKYQLFTGDTESNRSTKDIKKTDKEKQESVLPPGYGNGRKKLGKDGEGWGVGH